MSEERSKLGLVQESSISNERTNNIRVNVGGWSTILDVTFALGVCGGGRDSHRGSAVGDTVGESVAG